MYFVRQLQTSYELQHKVIETISSLAIHSSLALVNFWFVFLTLTQIPEVLHVLQQIHFRRVIVCYKLCIYKQRSYIDGHDQNWERGSRLTFRDFSCLFIFVYSMSPFIVSFLFSIFNLVEFVELLVVETDLQGFLQ